MRERVDDIALLADSILRRIASARAGSSHKASISADAMAQLRAYAWPGNIRELRNVLERANLLADGGVIRAEHLPQAVSDRASGGGQDSLAVGVGLPRKLTDAELARAAAQFRGKRSELAAQLGLSERTLYRRLKAIAGGEGA
ncbi:helix-turn-helix domain-containing protein [Paraburkholderia sp. CI3]|uniref:helix-turn-helix domain-containing protein n=1 Tax=Paraburkholderia sp. CI3 TaxID=2991060 RepID=UPI003D206E8C